jgi:predicted nucleic acid-binding protein
LSRLVLDASVAVAWCFEDETTAYADRILNLLAEGEEATVPPLWPYEVANALIVAERRARITLAKVVQFLVRLNGFAISIDPSKADRVFERVLSLARAGHISVYDAAYLELALREGIPLATLDVALRSVAQRAGVSIAGAK